MKVGLVLTNHSSSKIRPYGRELLYAAIDSFEKTCKYSFEIIIVDNQSDIDLRVENPKLTKKENIHYLYIEDQWKRGLTGAWNEGIAIAFKLGCDIILNSNDDLIFNDTINSFISGIENHKHKNMSIFGPTTNGVTGPFVKIQKDSKPNPQKTKEVHGEEWHGFINGFFMGFTSGFYENFRYSDGDLFAEFDKFDKRYIHEFAGDCGKWGGQEMEIKRFKQSGGRVFVIGECWIYHLKKKDWSKARQIAGEYGWHLKEGY